ncbi:MFS transporter [Actinoplanes derwentensis]|uniref:Predicted arabinose efflux permease, MFS family n=1 Tax=Actinoplanes derwentensis TaxID=113562 RepID=A0A1H1SV14_9ACTN|nr:MFS transporter [Actinoplanes derwentensis]GID83206.1 MFS transporter [Actinoplanes derwentensis]SDS51576.1 Predicted arabinose efflux permease, MFS family [Actinoplanes derwentensis]
MSSPWRLRGPVLAAYAINGFSLASWNVRLPAIAETAGLDTGELGRFLMAGAIGTLVTIPLTGRWVARWGEARVYLTATIGFVFAYLALGLALQTASVAPLFAAHALHGAVFAATNVPQSVLGTIAEARVGRSILSQFHAAYSIAAAAGAAAGGVAATAGMPPDLQFVALAVVALAGRGAVSLTLRHAPSMPTPSTDPSRRSADASHSGATPSGSGARPVRAWRDSQVLLLGLVVFGAALSEGAANNWVTPTLVENFPISEGAAATAVSVFLIAQTIGRLAGGRFVDRVGPKVTLIVSGLVATAGIVAFSSAQALWVCWIAVAVWGLGAALSLPVAVSVVARGPNAAHRIAAVASLSSLANVAGPPLIGAAADFIGLRWALGSLTVILLSGVLAARFAVRPPTPAVAALAASAAVSASAVTSASVASASDSATSVPTPRATEESRSVNRNTA